MKMLRTLLIFLAANTASAQTLHTFKNGEVADADKINQNFTALKEALEAIDGNAGASLLTGQGGPQVTLGNEGDVYIDTASMSFYGPKGVAGWGDGASLLGPQGEQGLQGEAGSQGPQGSAGPIGPQGEAGPQGPQGETGLQGPQGIPGEKGDTGAQGPKGDSGSSDCSALQQTDGVMIQCADGTSAMVAAGGTVVIYPEGQLGEVPNTDLLTGDIVVLDANDVVLGGAKSSNGWRYEIDINPNSNGDLVEKVSAFFVNRESDSTVFFGNANSPKFMYYTSSDCSGVPFLTEARYIFFDGDRQTYFTRSFETPFFESEIKTETLFSSRKKTVSSASDTSISTPSCEPGEYVVRDFHVGVEYTPAPEILNAAYPVRLEQLP